MGSSREAYDSNGNLTQKIEGTDTWTYEWDAENRLKRVLKNSVEQARFAYDPLGRRVEKVAGGVTTSYTYEGDTILRETTSTGTTLKYIHGPRIDEQLAQEDGAGVLIYFHADGLASIVKTTNSAGAVVASRRYDAYGNLEIGASNGYSFTGREWDSETGFYYLRKRYYDPKSGRFISEDPIGFFGGLNLYRYVKGNPTNLRDPFGLAPQDEQCCPTKEEPQIRQDIEKIHRRLNNLKKRGTALLSDELAAGQVTAGGVSGCASNGQYFVTIDPKLPPCIRKCVIFHEKTHERQCRNFGPERFANLSEAESEIPGYMNELGCLIRILKEGGLYP